MDETTSPSANTGTQRPSRRRNRSKRPEFTVFVELAAVMDYMTKLRGITTEEKYYPNRTSFELTRFPSFDGSDWDLPEPFEDFFEASVHKRDLFESVKPYDFAVREIEFLRQKGADTVIYVPLSRSNHYLKVKDWVQRYFPRTRIVAGDIRDINQQPDLWVARSRDVIDYLKKTEQPFVAIDGKENAKDPDVVRAIRWDQAGFVLRHSQELHTIATKRPHHFDTLEAPRIEGIAPHLDVFHGVEFFPPNVSEAAIWVGREQAITETFLDPEFEYRFASGKKMPKASIDRVQAAALADKKDLAHKESILKDFMQTSFELRLRFPKFAHWISMQELEMQAALRAIEKVHGVNPITGATKKRKKAANIPQPAEPEPPMRHRRTPEPIQPTVLSPIDDDTNKIKISRADLGLPADAEARDLITYFATASLATGPSAIHYSQAVGTMAEKIALHVFEEKGWKVFQPRSTAPRTQTKIPGQIVISWFDGDGNKQQADVDGLAKSPDGTLHVIEAKASPGSKISARQRRLKDHLDSGGKILNPDCVGLRKSTMEFDATYTIVTFANTPEQSSLPRRIMRNPLSR
jgi:hypothetical protein